MTVSSETAKSGPYTGNGATTVFAYGFRILNATHIEVVRTVNGVDSIVSPSDYTVSGVGNLAGGNVTFLVAPATGQSINIIRNAPFTQQVDLENQGAYYAETIEQALDLAVMRDQQMQEEIGRSVKLPVGSTPGFDADELIADLLFLRDLYLGAKAVAPSVDNQGDPLRAGATYWDTVSSQMFTWSGVAWLPTFLTGNAVRALVIATGGQTVVTVPTFIVGANTIQVYLNGLKAMVGADYTETSQNTITFLSALTGGDEVEILVLQPYLIGTTGAESITTVYGINLARLLELKEGTVAELLADTTLNPAVVPVGSVIEAGGFRYEVAASGATNNHVATAGGLKLYVHAKNNAFPFDAFSAFSGALTGSRDNAVLTKAVTAAAGKALELGAGPYDFSSWPAGLDDVHVIGTPFSKFNNLPLPIFTGVFTGNKQVAVVAAVLRYYTVAADGVVSDGWYLIQAKSGAHHDPVLLGPITASGAGSLNLDVDFSEFGIDDTIWTPSGFVCGPDEGFVADGVIFGASVGTDSVTITGSFTGDRTCIVTWTTDGIGGGTLTGSNAPYIFTVNADGIVSAWTGSGANRALRLYREPINSQRKAYNANSKSPMIGCRRSASSIAPVIGSFKSNGTTTGGSGQVYEYFDVFVDKASDGTLVTDATNQTFALTISDPMARAVPFTFNTPPADGSNIWIVGVFTKKAAEYPA